VKVLLLYDYPLLPSGPATIYLCVVHCVQTRKTSFFDRIS